MLHAIASAFIGVATFISSLFGAGPQYIAPPLGAALPSATAVFETSLQSRISSTDTSLTLVANNVRGGTSLSGYQCFTVDEGRTDAEFICGTISGTSVTGLTRGVDPQTGTTTNSTLKFAHRVGANVKITDFPVLQILRNQANGSDTYPNPLRYASGVAPSAVDDLTDKGYVDGVAFSGAGVIDASSVAKGVVELAAGCEAASSTASGTSGTLVVPASLATSTYNSATAACRIVSTSNNGKIEASLVATTTLFTNSNLIGTTTAATSTTYVGDFPAWQIGKQFQVFTSTGTTTFSVPSGITRIFVELCGGGGAGGGATTNPGAGGGGGGAGCAEKMVNVNGTSTIQLYVADATETSKFGTNGFYFSATGGTTGTTNASAGSGGGAPGTGVNGDINYTGSYGAPSPASSVAGVGGASRSGGGGGVTTGQNGSAGGTYGGGGGGASDNGTNRTGGAGAQGIVIVRW
jgi:hypothetical protein